MSTLRVMSSLAAPAALVCSMLAPMRTPLGAQPLPGYGPSNGRYRVASTMKQTQTQMGQSQEFESSSNQLVTLVVARSGAALSLSMTIDSITASVTAPLPTPDVSSMIGANVAGAMEADGHLPTTTVTDKAGKPMTTPAGANLRPFLPRLKVGASSGATWSDTTKATSKQNGADVNTTTIVNYTLAGDTTIAGARSWKVTSTTTGTIDGAGSMNGADFSIKGTLNGKGTMVIGAGGVLLGGTMTNDVTMTVDVPMASMQIPITQTSTTNVSRIP